MERSSSNFGTEAQEQTLHSIQSLQNLEKELYSNLEKMTANDENINLQKQIINKINDVSQTRIALFDQLRTMYITVHDTVNFQRDNLDSQLKVIRIVEKELAEAQKRSGLFKEANLNNKRKIEINTYYSKKYRAYYEILKIIFYTLIPLIVIVLLYKFSIISEKLALILGILIIIVPAVLILFKLTSISLKNNMNFEKINFFFDPNKSGLPKPPSNSGRSNDLTFGVGGCFNSFCCGEGLEYDEKSSLCINPKSSKENGKMKKIMGQSTQDPGKEIDE